MKFEIESRSMFKYSLIFLILLTCATDVITFFTSGLFEYEINPIVLYLKNIIGMYPAILIAVCAKVAVIIGLAVAIWKIDPKKSKSHVSIFLLVFLSVFVIALQGAGTYLNIHTTIEYNKDPINTQPLPVEQSTQILTSLSTIFYIVTALNAISFWFYEKMYRI